MSITSEVKKCDALSMRTFGVTLRELRLRCGMSQAALAQRTGISTRHLSYLENARAQPSRDMVRALARALEADLRRENDLMVAAGFLPTTTTTAMDAAGMALIRTAVQRILTAHQPYPCFAVDRVWNVVAANGAAERLFGALLAGVEVVPSPINVIEMACDPTVRTRIENWSELAAIIDMRIGQGLEKFPADAQWQRLRSIFAGARRRAAPQNTVAHEHPVAILRLRIGDAQLCLHSVVTTFGTALDAAVQELTLESFFPIDSATDAWFCCP